MASRKSCGKAKQRSSSAISAWWVDAAQLAAARFGKMTDSGDSPGGVDFRGQRAVDRSHWCWYCRSLLCVALSLPGRLPERLQADPNFSLCNLTARALAMDNRSFTESDSSSSAGPDDALPA